MQSVPVKVYYESLCSDSLRFFLNKLVPTYNDENFTGLLANLEVVPYGHVYNPNFAEYKYTCQHGVPECEGNKLHGCAVKYIEDKRVLLNYIACLMNITKDIISSISSYPANECRTIVPADKMDNISKCYSSNEGWNLFNQNGMATESFFGGNSFYVPYISLNHIKNEHLSSRAEANLKKVLCEQNRQPELCSYNKG